MADFREEGHLSGSVGWVSMARKCFLPVVVISIIFFVLWLAFTASSGAASLSVSSPSSTLPNLSKAVQGLPSTDIPPPKAPRLAYMISGSKGDGQQMRRLLQALYHPRNYYVLHLEAEAPQKERLDLALYIRRDPTFKEVGNVHVVSKSNQVTYRGVTMVSTTLQGAAILFKKSADWDWFINLSATDYPLMTQDDLLHVLSMLPRDLNFVEHTSDLAWKEYRRVRPVVLDPALYMSRKTDLWETHLSRKVPTAFRVFTGSAWAVLSRAFMEFTIMGWDSLPRMALLYFGSVASSPEFYFHTVVCNAREFRNTTVNHDLHYIAWDHPPSQHPRSLGNAHFYNMTESGAAFARKFRKDDPVLDRIDKELLGRTPGRFTPGGWCIGGSYDGTDPCKVVGDRSILRPGPGSERLEQLLLKLLHPPAFRSSQCIA